MVTRYAVLQDIHGNVDNVQKALKRLDGSGVSKIIVNGDIGELGDSIEEGTKSILSILEPIAKTKLEVFVQPGGHENFFSYNTAIGELRKYPNIVDVMNQKVYDNGHRLVFIPGADIARNGSYFIRSEMLPGRLALRKFGLSTMLPTDEEIRAFMKEESLETVLEFISPYSLRSLVQDPGKTIVICHIPRRFDFPNAVDVAYFARSQKGISPGIVIEQMIIEQTGVTDPKKIKEIARQNGFELKRGNVGEEDLAAVFEDCGIRFAVNGHIHEAGHRAHSKEGKDIENGEYVDELFWNAGCLKEGKFGILTVGDGKVAYTNLST